VRKVRGIIALLLAIGLAGIAAYSVYVFLNRPQSQQEPVEVKAKAPPPLPPPKKMSQRIEPGMRAVTLSIDTAGGMPHELSPGDRVDVMAVASAPDLPEGRITRQLLTAVQVMAVDDPPQASGRKVRERSVTLTVTPVEAAVLATTDPAAKLRLVLRNPEDEDQDALRATAFSPSMGTAPFQWQQRNLDVLIAPGMRAITLDVAATDGVNGIFRPGDRVDVVVTSVWGNVALQSQNKPGETGVLKETHRNSRILLQNIRVIATDRSLAWETDLNQRVARVTLEVSPRDAERLTVLADSKKGRSIMRLISRRGDDPRQVRTPGAELLDQISDKIPYTTVEMIRGPSRKDQTFYR
jgi:Flp pilus assembly protein CpaB